MTMGTAKTLTTIKVSCAVFPVNVRTFAPMNTEELEGKRIAVLLSGGVDSSVVVYELASLGLHPDCFYIKIGPEENEEWDCSREEDMEMATAVARGAGGESGGVLFFAGCMTQLTPSIRRAST